MEKFSSRLRHSMDYRSMTSSELSSKTKIGKSSISQWLNGKYVAKQDKIYILASALDVSPAWLMGYEVPMLNENNDEKISVEDKQSKEIINLKRENEELRAKLKNIQDLLK